MLTPSLILGQGFSARTMTIAHAPVSASGAWLASALLWQIHLLVIRLGRALKVYDAWFFFIGHRRYVKDGHWIRDAGFWIGKR